MRVLIPLDNTGGGGIARVGEELVRGLAAELGTDDRLELIGGAPALAGLPAVHRRPAPTPARGGRLGELAADQLRMIGPARHVDLVHGIDTKAPLLSATPFSITVHDLTFIDHPDWYPRAAAAYKRLVLAAALRRRPRLVVCVSEHTRQRLEVHHPGAFAHGRVVVIPSGVSGPPAAAPPPDPSPAMPVAAGSGRGWFLTVSAIEPRKNHLGLLAAFAQARREGLELDWVIVGRPQYAAEPIVQALSRAPGVRMLGRVSEAELERLYAGARFAATPSIEEGFGLPPLEAMRRGVPVIASTGSALDETVGDAGVRVAARDTAGWARALTELAGDPALATRLADAGRAQAARFTWAAAAAAYLREFRAAVRSDR